MLNNISKKKVFGWSLWRHIEKQRSAISTQQMERWHLRDLHDGRKVSYLTRWLASHVRNSTNNATVSVESNWIDHYPQAHSRYVPATGAPPVQVSVELADLLLVVEVQNAAGITTSKRAALLQAKCSNRLVTLDRSYAGTSTQDERHLLEANCDSIRVTSGTGASSPPIEAMRPDYDLDATATKPGLKKFARYLLIPRVRSHLGLPYMTMWPNSLAQLGGNPAHFSDVMLAMAGMGTQNIFSGAAVDSTSRVPDWNNLVDDLTAYCKATPPLNRFHKKTGTPISRHERREYDVSVFQRCCAFFIGVLRSASDRGWLGSPMQLNIMPKGRGVPPPRDFDFVDNRPVEGFTVLTVTIKTSEPLKPAEKLG